MMRALRVALLASLASSKRLADLRGFFELHMELTVPGAGGSVLFVTRDYRIDEDAAALCAAVGDAARGDECVAGVTAAARDVHDRCLYLIHLGAGAGGAASCKFVVEDNGSRAPGSLPANASLVEIADRYDEGPGLEKYRHYFEIYERFLGRLRGREVRFLEIGIADGGSSVLWRRWLGEGLELHCLDVNDRCAAGDPSPRTFTHHGDQADPAALAEAAAGASGPFDVVVDDGGHAMRQQIASFEALYPALAPGGVYIVEDVHTSYWPSFGGDGARGERSFMDFARAKMDELHYFRSPPGARSKLGAGARAFAASTKAISVFESVVVFEKHGAEIDARDLAPSIRGDTFTPGVGQRADSTAGIGYPLYDVAVPF